MMNRLKVEYVGWFNLSGQIPVRFPFPGWLMPRICWKDLNSKFKVFACYSRSHVLWKLDYNSCILSDGKLEVVVPSFVHYLEVLEGSDGDKLPGIARAMLYIHVVL